MSTWQPIETAKKDGVKVLLWLRKPYRRVTIASWFDPWGVWIEDGDEPVIGDDMFGIGSAVPSHWMPLPEPPEDA
jgi:hypothetical protein